MEKTQSQRLPKELADLLPELRPKEIALLAKNRLGFKGERILKNDCQALIVTPTPIGCHYWLWTLQTLSEGSEIYTKQPMPISRMPLSSWTHFSFRYVEFEPRWNLDREPARAEKNSPGSIYVIEAAGSDCVKIGFSRDTASFRLSQLQTGCPFELVVLGSMPGTQADEKSIHHQFRKYRIRGEWFRVEGPISEFIENVRLSGRMAV